MKTPKHILGSYIISLTGIPRRTFFDRAITRSVDFIELFRKGKLYSTKDWNKKNPDYQIPDQFDA